MITAITNFVTKLASKKKSSFSAKIKSNQNNKLIHSGFFLIMTSNLLYFNYKEIFIRTKKTFFGILCACWFFPNIVINNIFNLTVYSS